MRSNFIKAIVPAVLLALASFTSCDPETKNEEPKVRPEIAFAGEIQEKVGFNAEETKTFDLYTKNVDHIDVTASEGWTASCENLNRLSVTAPAGTDASEGTVVLSAFSADNEKAELSLNVYVTSEEKPGPEPEPEPQPELGNISLECSLEDDVIVVTVVPDNKEATYFLGLDRKQSYDNFGNDEDFIAYDIEYWMEEYGGDLTEALETGDNRFGFEDMTTAGEYIVYAYYVNADGTGAAAFTKEFVTVEGGTTDPDPTPDPGDGKPVLGLAYEIGDGQPFGYPGKAAVIIYCQPNEYAADWYYGSMDATYADYYDDETLKNNLKADPNNFRGKNFLLYPYDWGLKKMAYGFAIDANGNESELERIIYDVSLGQSSSADYDAYLGEWTVSGNNAEGKPTSFDIFIEENVWNDSYDVYGFTTSVDRDRRAPAKVNFKNGVLEFYESTVLGTAEDGSWLAFVGLARSEDDPTKYTYFGESHQTIATGVRNGNSIDLTWKKKITDQGTYEFVSFLYGYMSEDDAAFNFFKGEETRYVLSDMKITKKGSTSSVRPASARPDLPSDSRHAFKRQGSVR